MTVTEISDKARPLLPAAFVLALVAATLIVWNHDHHKLVAALRDAEAARLKLAGQIVADQDSAKELRKSIGDLTASNEDLKKAYDEAKRAAPGASPTGTAHLSTGTIIAHGTGTPLPGAASSVPPPISDAIPPPVAHSGEGGTSCLLAEGDQMRIDVDEITLETRQGNVLVAGAAAAYRVTPPALRLGGGGFSATLSDVDVAAKKDPPRWGAGATAICGSQGCSAGPALALPPLRFWGLEIAATAGLTLVGGPTQGTATGVIRF